MDSKKIIIFSDTHGSSSVLKTVLNWAKDRIPPNGTIHCAAFLGDGISDIRHAAESTGFYSDWKYVRGNNDYEASVPDSAVFEFADHRFYMCHGHRHSLYGSYHMLVNSGHSNNANIVLFGHTHVPYHKNVNGILLVNPGSAGRPRSRIGSTFAVIECTPGEMPKVEFWGIGNNKVYPVELRG